MITFGLSRTLKGWTQQQAADRIGVNRAKYEAWEKLEDKAIITNNWHLWPI